MPCSIWRCRNNFAYLIISSFRSHIKIQVMNGVNYDDNDDDDDVYVMNQ